ncbi:hypothetical protein BDD12DRAFT_982516 [Trichophaea hybrida]|nr:hypothetical protein BDD12DRAFT_982516 [Trichophaea hybrida]
MSRRLSDPDIQQPHKRIKRSPSYISTDRGEPEAMASFSRTETGPDDRDSPSGGSTGAPMGSMEPLDSLIATPERFSYTGKSSAGACACGRTPKVGPTCFRIANIPQHWGELSLLDALQNVEPCMKDHTWELSIYPACVGWTQTALLNLPSCSTCFQSMDPNETQYLPISDEGSLSLDRHFRGLTPLNKNEGDAVVDVVTVTGLAGHSFGSWRHLQTYRMWLKDFLPKDIKFTRIMSYGYDSRLLEGSDTNTETLQDYRRNFLEHLENSRVSAKDRPIILLGHSLGGILVLQALIRAKWLFTSMCGLFLFGTPHLGLQTAELKALLKTEPWGQKKRLLDELTEVF